MKRKGMAVLFALFFGLIAQNLAAQSADQDLELDENGLVHTWKHSGRDPYFKDGIPNEAALKAAAKTQRWRDGLRLLGISEPLSEELSRKAQAGEFRKIYIKPFSTAGMFSKMLFGDSKIVPDPQKNERMVMWVGDPTKLAKGEEDILEAFLIEAEVGSVKQRLVVPRDCGNLALYHAQFAAKVVECLDWEIEVLGQRREGDEILVEIRVFKPKKDRSGVCEEKTLVVRVPVVKDIERVSEPQAQLCPTCPAPPPPPSCPEPICDTNHSWGLLGEYPGVKKGDNGFHAKKQKFNLENFCKRWNPEPSIDPQYATVLASLTPDGIWELLRVHPDMKEAGSANFWFVERSRCNGLLRVRWSKDGWHWREFFVGYAVGFATGYLVRNAVGFDKPGKPKTPPPTPEKVLTKPIGSPPARPGFDEDPLAANSKVRDFIRQIMAE